jgi:23S rRNA (guanosine2251-2'-O)-methyltransferase
VDDKTLEPHKVGLDLSLLPELPRSALRLVLDHVRSAHNTGALFRTADAAAVDLVYLLGLTPHPPHPQLEKTALGATRYVEWRHHAEAETVLAELTQQDYTLIALDNGPGSIELWDFKWPRRTALVAGNEVEGVSKKLLEASEFRLNLPMHGYKRSLNVTTALGIAIYDYLRTFRIGQG